MSRNRRSREFTGVARVAGAVAVVVSLVAGCSADPGSTSSVTVRALWFGKDASGNLASGVTPLTIMETRSQVPQPFRVDLSGMSNAAAGEVWTAAAATASVVATLVSGQDPRYLRPSFSLDESIDGPSAGALTTAGTFAAISRADVRPEVTMTGTILPDGGIGYVGGIPEKIRGAAANGITEVFIPAGQEKSQDPRTRRTVDVVELGRQLGVKVNSARTVWDAYPTLTGRRATAGYSQADPPAVSSQTIDAITAAARQAMQRTRDGLASVPAGSVDAAGLSGAALRTSVTGQLVNAEDELAKGDSFAAYATASAVEQQLLAWQADTSIASSVRTKGVGATREALLQSTADLQRQAEAQFATTTATPTSTLEQLVELPYVAGRDIAVLGTCEKSVEALGAGSATDAALLRRVAVTLAPARYRVEHRRRPHHGPDRRDQSDPRPASQEAAAQVRRRRCVPQPAGLARRPGPGTWSQRCRACEAGTRVRGTNKPRGSAQRGGSVARFGPVQQSSQARRMQEGSEACGPSQPLERRSGHS